MERNQLKLICREFVGFQTAFQIQSEQFEKKFPGWDVQREFVNIEHIYGYMVKQKGTVAGDYDLFLCLTDWFPEIIRDKGFLAINQYLDHDPPEGWPDAWVPSLRKLQTGKDGLIYGLAYHDGPEVFIYRHDLFQDPKEQEAFAQTYGYALGVPATWSQFLDAARFFTRPEQNLYGAVLAGYPDGHNNVYDFYIHLWSRGGELLNEQWEPVFHGEIGQEALEFLVDLLNKHQVVPPSSTKMDSVASGQYYAEGKAAMMWNWSGFAGMAEVPEISKVAGKTTCTHIPRGDGPLGRHISLVVYWVLAITAGCKKPEMAYQFIKETASAAMDKVTSLSGATGTRLSTWRDPGLKAQFPFYSTMEEVHENVRTLMAIPEYPAINEILSCMVDDAFQERISAKQALSAASKKIRSILKQNGYIKPPY